MLREKTKRKFPENKYRTQNNQVRIQLLKSWKKIFLSSAQAPQWGWLRRISNFFQSRSFSQPGHNAAQAFLASVANVCTEPNWSGHIRTAEILLNLFAPDGIDQNILVVTCTFADRHFYARAFGSEYRCVIEGNFDLTRVIAYVGMYKGSMTDALIEGLWLTGWLPLSTCSQSLLVAIGLKVPRPRNANRPVYFSVRPRWHPDMHAHLQLAARRHIHQGMG